MPCDCDDCRRQRAVRDSLEHPVVTVHDIIADSLDVEPPLPKPGEVVTPHSRLGDKTSHGPSLVSD